MNSQPRAWRLSDPEERTLVERMLGGDERAFDELADGYFPNLYRFALRRLGGDGELARELVQATVCKAIPRLRGFRFESSLFTWLCGCCNNEIRMHFRSRGRHPPTTELDDPGVGPILAAPASEGPQQRALRREEAQLVHLTLDQLPPRYARALEWMYLERVSVAEIAMRLGIRAKAAESLLTRARAAFRRGYEELLRGRRPGLEPSSHEEISA
jgi:RNA polymerase sigma-70 factor (ECF subfamily)